MRNLFVIVAALLLIACDTGEGRKEVNDAHSHGDHADVEIEKGSHGGRLLRDGKFAIEITIFEQGVPPEFHLYASDAGKAIDPAAVQVDIELTRLGGKIERFEFVRESAYLKSTMTVKEPHSFDVKVSAQYAGKRYAWTYASYEGRTKIAPEMAAGAGIKTAIAGSGALRETLKLHGTIRPDPQYVRAVSARFAGPIRAVHKQIGDTVKAGEVLAIVESNESLQTYSITSPIAGVLIERRANVGETAGAEPLFTVADYSRVVAELVLFARDRQKIKIGQQVEVVAADSNSRDTGKIDFIGADDSARHQSQLVRVRLENSGQQWVPGLYVSGEVTINTRMATLVVANSALQTFRDFTVVYAQVGDVYEVRMLQLGVSDGEHTEVIGGIDAGTRYVTDNSYLIKADIEKSGASHDH